MSHSNLVLTENIPTVFLDWNSAHHAGYQTKTAWKFDYGRAVNSASTASYQEVERMPWAEYQTRIQKRRHELSDDPEGLIRFEERRQHDRFMFISDGVIEIIKSKVPLYHESQTKEGNFRERTKAIIDFGKVFYRQSRHDEYIARNFDQANYPGRKWHTRNAENHNYLNGQFRYFGEQKLNEHLNHKNIYGVKANASKLQWWCVADIDLHVDKGGIPEDFFSQVEAVLTHVQDQGWIVCLNSSVVDGIHVLKIFDKPVPLSEAQNYAKSMLRDVAERFPGVALLGKKPLVESEIFPSSTRGFRLPLGKDYTALIDRPLDLVHYHTYNGVPLLGADMVSFMRWNGTEMPLAEKLDYIRSRLAEQNDKTIILKKSKFQPHKKSIDEVSGQLEDTKLLGTMKGRYRNVLVDFFSGKMQVPGSLQTGILLGANALWAQEFPYDDRAEYLLELLMGIEVTDPAFSTRMANQDWEAVLQDAEHIVDSVERLRANPKELKIIDSNRILGRWAEAMEKSGFVFGDTATWANCWNVCESKPWFTVDLLTDEDRKLIAEQIAPVMKCSAALATEIVVKMVQLASFKDRNGDGMSREYRRAVLTDMGIHCQENAKLARCWDVVKNNGFIYQKQGHIFSEGRRGRARSYGAGPRVAGRIQLEILDEMVLPEWLKNLTESHIASRWPGLVAGGNPPSSPSLST